MISKRILLALVAATALAASAQHIYPDARYELRRVIPVAGRQGIAADSLYYYVSDTRALYKYDKEGNLVASNLAPFTHPEIANHFGDIDIFDGELYCGIEKFEYGRGYNIAVSVYDANTLRWKRDFPWSPESGQVEVSGIAVDRQKRHVWLSDWVDSRYAYCYDLDSGRYHTKMQCAPTPYWCQGIFIADSKMIFSADDGEAAFNLPDNLYIADISTVPFTGLVEGSEPLRDTPFSVALDSVGKPQMRHGLVAAGAQQGRVELLRTMNDFRRAGEIEGVSIDPATDELLVVSNRGTSIVLGMSQGPLVDEGYTGEIHELYVYAPVLSR